MQSYTISSIGVEITVVTNSPKEREQKSLDLFYELKEKGHLSKLQDAQKEAWLPALTPLFDNDNWRYRLIEERVVQKGGTFRIESIKSTPDSVDLLKNAVQTASFAWVEGDENTISSTCIYVRDASGEFVTWGNFCDYLGIKVQNKPKSPKRFKEIVRQTLFSDYSDTYELLVHEVPFDSDMEIAVDGNGGMSMSNALRMAEQIPDPSIRARRIKDIKSGKVVTVNYRQLSSFGMIKGDRIIIPDEVLLKKFLYVPDLIEPTIDGKWINLKQEIRTDGWMLQTMNPHHAHAPAFTNDQLLGCLSKGGTWFFTADELKQDLDSWIDEFKDAMESGDAFPSHILYDTQRSGEFGHVDTELLASCINDFTFRWNISGLLVCQSSFLMKMVGNRMKMRMEKSFKPSTLRAKPNIRIPIRHSAYLYITTRAIIEDVCGYDLEADGYDTTKSFYHKPTHRWVCPDDVFIKNYRRHGGYDGDDSLMVAPRIFEMPDGTKKLMAAQFRMPLSYGEFSIVEFDDRDFPYYHQWNEMPTISYADRPEYIDQMDQNLSGMPSNDSSLEDDYTVDRALELIGLAMINPGVGKLVNKLIAYTSATDSYPKEQLAELETMLDTIMQEPYTEGLLAVQEEVDRLKDAVVGLGVPIDRHIWDTRIGGKPPKSIKLTKDSFFFEMISYCQSKLIEYNKWLDRFIIEAREEIPGAMEVKLPEKITVPKDGEINTKLYAGYIFRHFTRKAAAYPLYAPSHVQRKFSGDLNRSTVNFFLSLGKENWIPLTLALYQYVIENNLKDHVLFQTNLNKDEPSTMDLLIWSLYSRGLAQLPNEDGTFRRMVQLN